MNNVISFNSHIKRQATEKCVCGNPMEKGALACPECSVDLNYTISRFSTNKGTVITLAGEIPLAEYIKAITETEHGIGPVGTCSICGGRYVLWGHNPDPVIQDVNARCCARCNDEVVIPARMRGVKSPRAKRRKPKKENTHDYLQAATCFVILRLSETYELHNIGKTYSSLLMDKHDLYNAAIQSLESMTVGEFIAFLSDECLGDAPLDITDLSAQFGLDRLMSDEALTKLQETGGFWKEFFNNLMETTDIIVQSASRVHKSNRYQMS